MSQHLPYSIAVLCYLFDAQDQVLLLHRCKPPNQDLYSPVGGKLERDRGESPTDCAIREIHEETGVTTSSDELHLTGIVSETAFEGQTHWLMFLYELIRPVSIQKYQFDEGKLAWYNKTDISGLKIPETDRQVIWPLFWQFRKQFFMAHINCQPSHPHGIINWSIQQPYSEASSRS